MKLWNRWDLQTCTRGDFNLQDNVCCRFCRCQLAFIEPLAAQFDDSKLVLDLSNRMIATRAFKCDEVDHNNECETNCRRAVNDVIFYNSLNQINLDNYDPLSERNISNRICTVLNQTINSPGVNVVVRMETGPREISVHKDVNLGNICCNRTCECKLVYKHIDRKLNKVELVVDLEDKLPQRPLSYYCNDEVREVGDFYLKKKHFHSSFLT